MTSLISVSITVLKAINDDSPQVPSLLTDYILKGMSYESVTAVAKYATPRRFAILTADQQQTSVESPD